MTKAERVKKAIRHEKTDILPYSVHWTQRQFEKMGEYYGDADFNDKIGNHIDTCCCDNVFTKKPGSEIYTDIYGVDWNRSGADKDIGVIDNLVIPEPDVKKIKLPPLNEQRLHQYYQRLSQNKEQFKFGTISFSGFERAWTLCGMENVLVYMLTEQSFLHELMEKICERNLRIIDIALQYDIDGFHFGDDWGQQRGMIMGAALWREFIKPIFKTMFDRVKSKGLVASLHSCGDIYEVFGDLIDIGLDVYQTFQPEIYDVEKFKRTYGSNLTVWGGISTQRVLAFGKPEDVKAEMIRLYGSEKMGGFIMAPTHSVPPDCSVENCDMMLNIMQNQQKYFG